MKRYREIDISRGIGILFVVLGHALKQTGTLTAGMDALLSVIYSFHMPLFFLLAGFTSLKVLGFKNFEERAGYIRTRALRLLIPYFVIGILYLPLKYYMSRYALKPYDFSSSWKLLIGDNPNTALWFLYILFLCSAVGALFLNLKNLNTVLAASFLLCAVSCVLEWEVRFPRYFFFYILGIAIRSRYGECKNLICRYSTMVICALLFASGNYFLYRYDGLWFILTAVSGSILVLETACALTGGILPQSLKNGEKLPLWERGLETAGTYSMDIYIFSEPVMTVLRLVFWNKLSLPFGWCTLLCFLGAVILPVPISIMIVRKIPVLRFLFLGLSIKEEKKQKH